MTYLFLMDPLETVIMEKDTSFALMLGAYRKKHDIYFLPDGGIVYKNGKFHFHTTQVIPQEKQLYPFIKKEPVVLSDDKVDAIFVRSDPPFDYEYLFNTWMLDQLPKHITVINNPTGIRTANEKIWATKFKSIIPRTLISRNRNELLEFLKEEEESIVVKPTDGHGGKSVFHIKANDKNANVILETLTETWSRDIIAQQFIEEAEQGDKRILLLNGEPLGAVLRLHSEDDHRNNFFSGGKPLATDITDHDLKIIDTIKPELKRLGLFFVGIDILGNYLVEVNVTSPTCLREMNTLYKKNLESDVITFVEKLVEETRSSNRINA